MEKFLWDYEVENNQYEGGEICLKSRISVASTSGVEG